MQTVTSGDTVHIHYTGTLLDGTEFDSSKGSDPLSFTVGAGQVIPGLDKALPGLEVGTETTVTIPCAEAYGPLNPALRQEVPRNAIPDDIPTDVGTQLSMQGPNGQMLPVTVAAVTDEAIMLDANHALAGQDLVFTFTVVKIVG